MFDFLRTKRSALKQGISHGRYFKSYQFYGIVSIIIAIVVFYLTGEDVWLGFAGGSLYWLRVFY